MKRLIICNDGTWNTPGQEDNGMPAPTNVVKFYNAIDEEGNGTKQMRYYHPGVGTKGMWDSVVGGALGKGVDDQITSAYYWIATHYAPGDEIFIVGFSRGAFVARSLAGFLGRGLLDLGDKPADAWAQVKAAYVRGYRKFEERAKDLREWVKPEWKFFNGGAALPIRFVGVWDTVGALGVPDDAEILNLFDNSEKWRFHDTELGAHIRTARHAMAMDEIRSSFTITRWTNISSHPDVKEMWFPGVHSDVGGGYSNTDLSDGALIWMLDQAERAGLVFRDQIKSTLKPNSLGVLHNSYKGLFSKFRSRPRAMEKFNRADDTVFHQSTLDRQKYSPISYPLYRPTYALQPGESKVCEIFADNPWNDTGIYMSAGETYTFVADGQWMDAKDVCDWEGTQNDKFTFGDVIRSIGSAIGSAETAYKKLTGNASTDFLGTKRAEGFRWFCMVGAIANDKGKEEFPKMPNDGSPNPHEYIELFEHVTDPRKVTWPGYFYCFANDVWALYGNNKGSIQLTVTRVA